MFKLRDYQSETIKKIQMSLTAGNKSMVVQSPPRSGKTLIMAEIARRATDKNNRVLFIVHRKEIVDQVKKTFENQGVDMKLAQIGMVQTFSKRLESLFPPQIIFIDEAHHALAKSYTKIIDHYPEAVKLLFTGTPWRMNGKGFEDVATDIIVGKSIKWLQQHGHIAPFDYYAPQDIDTSQLKVKSNGEFDSDSISHALKPKIYGSAVKNYKELADETQAIAYTYNVESAHTLADEFNQAGIRAAAVDGKTPPERREAIVQAYKAGEIRIVTNAELYTEGVDLPAVDTVIMMRPTQSLSLYLQFSMRALNPRDGKVATLIDHVGNVGRFGLPNEDRKWTLEGQDKRTRKLEAAQQQIDNPIITCDACFGTFYKKQMVDDVCPYCGEPYTTKTITYDTDETAKLRKVLQSTEKQKRIDLVHKMMKDQMAMNVADKSVSDLSSIEELKAYAEIHGYKQGWVYHQAKQKRLLKGK